MSQHTVRVIVASEYPEVRAVLRKVVETEDKTVIVGEAETGARAVILARNLRPDVAVIDSHLPSVVGLDNVPMSRAGGLDAAQLISEEIPNVHVVLLSSIAERVMSDSTWRPELDAHLCKDMDHTCVPFTLRDLPAKNGTKAPLVFANVEPEEVTPQKHHDSFGDKAVFYGAIVAGLGWLLVLTIAFANIGIFVFFAGLLTALFGACARLVASRFARRTRPPKSLSGRRTGTEAT